MATGEGDRQRGREGETGCEVHDALPILGPRPDALWVVGDPRKPAWPVQQPALCEMRPFLPGCLAGCLPGCMPGCLTGCLPGCFPGCWPAVAGRAAIT